MLVQLSRDYLPGGTNGTLFIDGVQLCHSIELPWKDNLAGISCIPEGRYTLSKRYSPHLNWHCLISHVPGRELILLHPANDALKELKGCIAPVTVLTGAGKGLQSRNAFNRLTAQLFPRLEQGQPVYLEIKKSSIHL